MVINPFIVSAAKGFWRMGGKPIEIAGILNLKLWKVEYLIHGFEVQDWITQPEKTTNYGCA